jgi:hypothetical protein
MLLVRFCNRQKNRPAVNAIPNFAWQGMISQKPPSEHKPGNGSQ